MNPTDIADLSNNKYAAVMREFANGLAGWASLLLIPFILYQIYAHETASIFSIKGIAVLLLAEIVFYVLAKLANIAVGAIFTAALVPLVMYEKITLAQNIQNTWMAFFGLSLCIGAWFFAGYAVNYAYGSSDGTAKEQAHLDPYFGIRDYPDNWEPRVFQCHNQDFIPDFTLGHFSDPSPVEVDILCDCIEKNTEHAWVRETGRKLKGGEEVTNAIQKAAFPARFSEKIKACVKDF